MAFKARYCIPVVSSWVYQLIQGCNDEFAVQFKRNTQAIRLPDGRIFRYGGSPGVICHYHTAPASMFQFALIAPSKGRFVHQFLFKKYPYKVIGNPCPAQDCQAGVLTNCCPTDAVPETLNGIFSAVGVCSCMDGKTVTLTWNGTKWAGTVNACGGDSFVELWCRTVGMASDFVFDLAVGSVCSLSASPWSATTLTCNPFQVDFASVGMFSCCLGTVDLFTVTE